MFSRYVLCVAFLVLLSSCSHIANKSAAIVKSEADEREYQSLVLSNGLKVLLVSDPTTDMSAASLDVYVGSGDDPIEREGLAHFLEHMLFLGTKKYPASGEYQQFIKNNSGSHNAYTSFEHTNYFFDIAPEALEKALDRFAQFFIEPLFNEEYVEREKNAVDAEYRAKFKSEARRKIDVLKTIVNQEHDFRKFSVGSLETLSSQEVPVRLDLLAFYKKHYSAKNMALTVLGKEGLADLKEMVEMKFSAISDFDVEKRVIEEPLFKEGFLPKWVNIEPEKDIKKLSLLFPLPDQQQYYQQKPLAMIGHILGHEGKGSLLSYLKNKEWAEALSAGQGLSYKGGTVFSIDIALTEKGLEHKEDVVEAVFQAIYRLKNDGMPRWVFDELAGVSKLRFQYKEKQAPQHYVMALSNAMHYYNAEDVLVADYLVRDYKPELVKAIIRRLEIENCLLTLVSSTIDKEKVSPRFNAPYSVVDLSADFKMRLTDAAVNNKILIPDKNAFLPDDFSLEDVDFEQKKPVLILKQDNMQLWHKPLSDFKFPKATAYYSFNKEGLHKTAVSSVLMDLYVALLNDSLSENTYPAVMAGLNFKLYSHARGLTLKLSGFNDKQDALLRSIVSKVVSVEFSQSQYDRIKQSMLRQLSNAEKTVPYRKLINNLQHQIRPGSWSFSEKRDAIAEIDLNVLKAFSRGYWSDFSMVALNSGNINQSQAVKMFREVVRVTGLNSVEVKEPQLSVYQLADKAIYQPVESVHADAAYLMYWQSSVVNQEVQASWMLLGQAMESSFYHSLRTQQQLGYIVFATYYPVLTVPGLVFVVQSPHASEKEIHQSFDQYMADFKSSLVSLSEQQFSQYKQSLIQKLQETPKNLEQQSERYWYDLALKETGFDRRQKLALWLEKVTLLEWVAFAELQLSRFPKSTLLLSTAESSPASGFQRFNKPIKQMGFQKVVY